MGAPAAPTVHPDNQPPPHQYHHAQQPYVAEKPADNPFEHIPNIFNSWTHKAEEIAIWHNLKTGLFITGTAWGKVNLTAKAITEGGLESLFCEMAATTGVVGVWM